MQALQILFRTSFAMDLAGQFESYSSFCERDWPADTREETPEKKERNSTAVFSLSLSLASRVARVIPCSTSTSLLFPLSHFLSGTMSSGVTLSSSK